MRINIKDLPEGIKHVYPVNKEELFRLYFVENLSQTTIGKRLGISAQWVGRLMKKFGLKARTISQAQLGERNWNYGGSASTTTRLKMSLARRGEKNPFYGKHLSLEARENLSKAHQGKKLSVETKTKLSEIHKGNAYRGRGWKASQATRNKMSAIRRGKSLKAPMARRTTVSRSIRASTRYKEWRQAVYERDNFLCCFCKIGGRLNADHIRPFALLLHENNIQNLEDADNCLVLWDIANGRTLCISCHVKTDTFGGKGRKK